MYNLDTNTSLEIVRGHAATTNEMWVSSSYGDMNSDGTLSLLVDNDVNTAGTTPVTFVGAPSTAGQVRQVKRIEINNQDTVSDTVSILEVLASSTPTIKKTVTLASLYSLHYEDARGWYVTDSSGSAATASTPSGSAGGDITGTYPNPTIAAGVVTFAKMQNIATDSLIGRDTAGTGVPENILLNATMSMDGSGNLQRAALTGMVTAPAGSNATTVVTNANLTGPITSVGNATSIASQTGSGTKFVVDNTPTLITPVLGAATGTSLVLSSFLNEAQGTDVASGTTTNIGAAIGNYIVVTGTTTITAFDTVQAGTRRVVKFSGALTLTHNGTSLILPGAANVTTVAGDTATFISLGSGNWICVDYQKFTITGTGSEVRATTPTLVTPLLGTPTSGVLTNCTGLPEGGLSLTDITTNDASTTKHGFMPKGKNLTTADVFLQGKSLAAGTAVTGSVTSGVCTITHTSHGYASNDYVVIAGATSGGGIGDVNQLHQITVTTANAYTFVTTAGNGSLTGSPVESSWWSGTRSYLPATGTTWLIKNITRSSQGLFQLTTGNTQADRYWSFHTNGSNTGARLLIFGNDAFDAVQSTTTVNLAYANSAGTLLDPSDSWQIWVWGIV